MSEDSETPTPIFTVSVKKLPPPPQVPPPLHPPTQAPPTPPRPSPVEVRKSNSAVTLTPPQSPAPKPPSLLRQNVASKSKNSNSLERSLSSSQLKESPNLQRKLIQKHRERTTSLNNTGTILPEATENQNFEDYFNSTFGSAEDHEKEIIKKVSLQILRSSFKQKLTLPQLRN